MLALWEPLTGLSRVDSLLEQLWDGVPRFRDFDLFAPRTDAYETDEAYHYELDLPGVDKKDVKAEVKDGVLTVRAETKSEKKENRKSFLLRERSSGQFIRSYGVPPDADEGKFRATLENGILHVTLPKGEKARPREIPVA